jgi:hemolysin III
MYPWERLNSLSHLVGAVAAFAGVVLLLVRVAEGGDLIKIISFSIYGVTLFFLYLVSTLYHGLSGRPKSLFRLLDHQAIYLLIAGTYTPFTLVTLRDSAGWMFAVIWGLALFGIILDAVFKSQQRIVPVIVYLAMGWMVLFALDPLLSSLPAGGFQWLLAGGLFYTLGVVFFILDHWYPWAHVIWHLFVLAGSVSHYFAILLYV